MKYISILLTFCLSLNVLASSGTVQELEKELDNYHYAITVEWDQKDKKFYEEKTTHFIDQIASMNLSEEQILSVAQKKSISPDKFEALKLKLSVASKVKSSSELAHTLKEATSDMYGQGASWIGGVGSEEVLLGIGVVLLVGYLVWFNANYECGGYTEEYRCNTTTSGNSSSTVCGWHDVCSFYVEK